MANEVVKVLNITNQEGQLEAHPIGAIAENVDYSSGISVKTKLDSLDGHVTQGKVYSENGVHGFKYDGTNLQYKDNNNEWQTISVGGGGTGDMSEADQAVVAPGTVNDKVIAIRKGGTGNKIGYIQTGRRAGTAIGNNATAEGTDTTASGISSHAEGNGSKAIGDYSHAEGSGEATGEYSHAEGSGDAVGDYSHAGGFSSRAEGDNSFVSGDRSVTIGENSFIYGSGCKTGIGGQQAAVIGTYVQANGNDSFVLGRGKLGSEYAPILGHDCYNIVNNPIGFTIINGNKPKFETGAVGEGNQPISFSVSTNKDTNSLDVYDGTQGKFIELKNTTQRKSISIVPYGIYLLTTSAYDSSNATTPSDTALGGSMYYIIGSTASTVAPVLYPIVEEDVYPEVTADTYTDSTTGTSYSVIKIKGQSYKNIQAQLIRLA